MDKGSTSNIVHANTVSTNSTLILYHKRSGLGYQKHFFYSIIDTITT